MNYKKYFKKQIEGHKETEKYALTTHGYIELMKYLHGYIPKKGKILEIGCNTGYECIMIQNKNRQVTGIDIGKEFIEKTKSLGINAIIMDMHELKFPKNYFDCIYINNTLEHSHTPKKVFSEMFRVLKKDGKAIICIPSDYKNPNYLCENWNSSLHLWKPNFDEFKQMVLDVGFKIIKSEEIDAKTMFELENKTSYNHYMVVVCKK